MFNLFVKVGRMFVMLLTSKRESGSRRVQSVVRGSRTEQSHRKACNINTIMKRFRKTGALPRLRVMSLFMVIFLVLRTFRVLKTALLMLKLSLMLSLPIFGLVSVTIRASCLISWRSLRISMRPLSLVWCLSR